MQCQVGFFLGNSWMWATIRFSRFCFSSASTAESTASWHASSGLWAVLITTFRLPVVTVEQGLAHHWGPPGEGLTRPRQGRRSLQLAKPTSICSICSFLGFFIHWKTLHLEMSLDLNAPGTRWSVQHVGCKKWTWRVSEKALWSRSQQLAWH